MRYYVSLDPAVAAADAAAGKGVIVVDVTELPSGALDVKVDGRKANVDVVTLGSQLSVVIDGKVVDLPTEGAPPELGVIASGHRSYVRVESERQRAAEAARKKDGGGAEKLLKSPMPGRVVKVMVAKGDEVAVGQALMVVEAMKMENELKAKTAGTVGDIFVKAGDAVEANAKLIAFA